jgi:hypothetical protein
VVKVWQYFSTVNGWIWLAQARTERDAEQIAKAMKLAYPAYRFAYGVDRAEHEV